MIRILLLAATALSLHAEPINLWPGDAPGESETDLAMVEEVTGPDEGKGGVLRIGKVSVPTLEHFAPTNGQDTGVCVLIAPGGGYNILAAEHEGTRVAEFLNKHGIHAALLKYRVPRREGRLPHEAPLEDAQRAMTLLRENAQKWGFNPEKIGMLGFSAGGNLTMFTGVSGEKGSTRPDFLCPIYPAYLAEHKPDTSPNPLDLVTSETPPAIFIVGGEDKYVTSSLAAYQSLHKAKVPAELHIYSGVGHGFGISNKQTGTPVGGWMNRVVEWIIDWNKNL